MLESPHSELCLFNWGFEFDKMWILLQSNILKGKLLSRVQLLAIPWTVSHHALLSIELSKQEYWSGLPFLSPGGLPDPGTKSTFTTSGFFTIWSTKAYMEVLRVPWTARRSNQSILKEINSEYPLEGLMLKLEYFGHLMQRAGSLEKTLMLGKIKGKRRKGQQRMRWVNGITDSMDMNLSKLKETVKDRKIWHTAVHRVAESWTWLGNWPTTTMRKRRDQEATEHLKKKLNKLEDDEDPADKFPFLTVLSRVKNLGLFIDDSGILEFPGLS